MHVNLTDDPSMQNAPETVSAAAAAAVAYLDSTFTDDVTATFNLVYGTPPEMSGDDWVTYNVQDGQVISYAALAAAFPGLPAADPLPAGAAIWLPDAQAALLGIPTDDPLDGTIYINPNLHYSAGTDIAPGSFDLTDSLIHEATELAGRLRLMGTESLDGSPLYTAMDVLVLEGKSWALPFNQPLSGGDLGDWSITGDAFGGFAPGQAAPVSWTDLELMSDLGWSINPDWTATATSGATIEADGNDTVIGGDSDHVTMIAGSGDVTFTSGTGGNSILGGGGGTDVLIAMGTGDIAFAGFTDIGNSVAEYLYACTSGVTLAAGYSTGPDVYGAPPKGDVTIIAGQGDSQIWAGGGTDTLWLGTGHTTVIAAAANLGGTADLVMLNFNPLADRIQLFGFGAQGAAETVATARDDAAGAAATLPDGSVIQFNCLAAAAINTSMFING